ncbi:MAG: Gfo/Idh/MocA family oxidoreductase [Pseudomonadota bacterium]
MLRALIIGCGRIAGNLDAIGETPITHAAAYRMIPGVKLVGCFDKDQDKASLFSKRYECEMAQSPQEAMGRLQPDIVSVCTPDSTHFETVKQLLCARYLPRVIFLEKPACRTSVELNELIRCASERQVDIVVNHTRRFDPCHRELRQRILSGEFGSLLHAHVIYYSGWQHNGVHIVDTLAFLFDAQLQIVRVTAALESPYPGDPTLELELALAHQSGRIVVRAIDEKFYQLFDFDLCFTDARLRIEDFGTRIILERKIVNEIGENILVPVNHGLLPRVVTPMQFAIKLIVERISTNDASLLNGYRLSDIAGTMHTIWKGCHLYENQTRSN